jgi:hypothetical protein
MRSSIVCNILEMYIIEGLLHHLWNKALFVMEWTIEFTISLLCNL